MVKCEGLTRRRTVDSKPCSKKYSIRSTSHVDVYLLTTAVGHIIASLEISVENSAFARRFFRPLPSR